MAGEPGLVVHTSLPCIAQCPWWLSWIEEWLGGMVESPGTRDILEECFKSGNFGSILWYGLDSFWSKICLPLKPETYSMFLICKEF